MVRFAGFVLSVVVLYSLKTDVSAQPAGREDAITEKELRKMLKMVLDQNEKLLAQNDRLQQVWSGLQQMCKAVTMSTCDCNRPQHSTSHFNTLYTNNNVETTTPPMPTPRALTLRVLTIKSTGIKTNPSLVTVTYTATHDHTAEWLIMRTNGGMWRTAGTTTQETPGSTLYTSTVDVGLMSSLRFMYFRLYNDIENVNIEFNLTEIERAQEQNLPPITALLHVSNSYWAPRDSDLNITAIVNRNVNDFKEFTFAEIFLTGLNTSAAPPAIFEMMSFNEDLGVNMSHRTESTSYLIITLRQPYVQYGGILTVRLPHKESWRNGMVEELHYGPFIKVYPPDAKDVVPPNTLGIFPVAKQMLVFPPTQSMLCAAMGNPRPDVTILKITDDGMATEKPTETLILDSYMNMKVLTLFANQSKATEGRYICRVSNGNRTIDAPTEAVVLVPAVFDEAKTGVTKNTSSVVVISCKVRGKPRPFLGLRLYEEYGPDLVRSGMYKTKTSYPNDFTSRVTLTLSPTDLDVHTVYCVVGQGDANASFDTSRKIEIYPGMEKEKNWQLFHRVQDSQVF